MPSGRIVETTNGFVVGVPGVYRSTETRAPAPTPPTYQVENIIADRDIPRSVAEFALSFCRAVGLALSGAAFALICIKCFAVNALQNPDFEVDLAGWEITASAPSPATYVNHWPYGWNNSAGSLGWTADLIN